MENEIEVTKRITIKPSVKVKLKKNAYKIVGHTTERAKELSGRVVHITWVYPHMNYKYFPMFRAGGYFWNTRCIDTRFKPENLKNVSVKRGRQDFDNLRK